MKIHEIVLRIAFRDCEFSFSTLLEKDDTVSIQEKNLQTLIIQMLKTKENINPPFIGEIFCERASTYNLRNNNEFLLPRVRTTSYGSETIKYRWQRLWLSLPQHKRNVLSVSLRKKLKAGNPTAPVDYVGL